MWAKYQEPSLAHSKFLHNRVYDYGDDGSDDNDIDCSYTNMIVVRG